MKVKDLPIGAKVENEDGDIFEKIAQPDAFKQVDAPTHEAFAPANKKDITHLSPEREVDSTENGIWFID